MEWNRNQFLMAGVILLLLGLQLRYVDSFVLTEDCSRFINKRLMKAKKKKQKPESNYPSLFANISKPKPPAVTRRTVKPPNWLGWAFLSVGAVLILQSFAMPKPGTS